MSLFADFLPAWIAYAFRCWLMYLALGAALVMTRCGMIAAIAYFFSQQLLEIYAITADVTEWYGSGTLMAVASISALAA